MKIKFILILSTIVLSITSCSDNNAETLNKASTKICNCLKDAVDLNDKLIKVSQEDTTDTRTIAIMKDISKSADSGFACVERTMKQYEIEKKNLKTDLIQLLETNCTGVAEMMARE